MVKITKTLLAGSIGVVTALAGGSQAQSQQGTVKNIVLVHGAFADGTSLIDPFLDLTASLTATRMDFGVRGFIY